MLSSVQYVEYYIYIYTLYLYNIKQYKTISQDPLTVNVLDIVFVVNV